MTFTAAVAQATFEPSLGRRDLRMDAVLALILLLVVGWIAYRLIKFIIAALIVWWSDRD
jgi:hypothetical protein